MYKYRCDTQAALTCKAVSPIQSFLVQINVYATFLQLCREKFLPQHLTTSRLLRTIFNQRHINVKINRGLSLWIEMLSVWFSPHVKRNSRLLTDINTQPCEIRDQGLKETVWGKAQLCKWIIPRSSHSFCKCRVRKKCTKKMCKNRVLQSNRLFICDAQFGIYSFSRFLKMHSSDTATPFLLR